MLLIDDLLFAPLHGLLWVARKVDDALSQEQEKEEEELKARLRELYLRLEAGQLGEQEFETQEAELLDRLDAILARQEAEGVEAGEEET
ncbi:gas vesicle protein GvpG [Archangium lipolyticum]|uniref:gas vesicle protein GvpG n=1 Tax=Archangium lipolyticum TaxID=2970465 RepID=UPI00214A1C98|nr:gas vesicle protein GvpG [Archangium lipolyticum]